MPQSKWRGATLIVCKCKFLGLGSDVFAYDYDPPYQSIFIHLLVGEGAKLFVTAIDYCAVYIYFLKPLPLGYRSVSRTRNHHKKSQSYVGSFLLMAKKPNGC